MQSPRVNLQLGSAVGQLEDVELPGAAVSRNCGVLGGQGDRSRPANV
jgi:hypothetical protein